MPTKAQRRAALMGVKSHSREANMQRALRESLLVQNEYARVANRYDGQNRVDDWTVSTWLEALRSTGKLVPGAKE